MSTMTMGEIDELGERTGMYSFSFFDLSGITIGRIGGEEMYSRLQGLWFDGEPITYGGDGRSYSTVRTRYMYTGDPSSAEYWTEFLPFPNGYANPPSDRRFLISAPSR